MPTFFVIEKIRSLTPHLFNSSFYSQLFFLVFSFGLALINKRIIQQKIKALPKKISFVQSFFDQKSFFLLVWLLGLAPFILVYRKWIYEDISFIQWVTTLTTTYFFIRVIQKKLPSLWALSFSYLASAFALLFMTGLLGPTLEFLNHTYLKVGFVNTSFLKILQSALLISCLGWVALYLSKKLELNIDKQVNLNESTKLLLSKASKTVLVSLALLFSLSIVGLDLSILTFFAGAIGVAIGFGLQNILSNIFCGVILLFDRSIRPGDVITLQDQGTYGIVHKLKARYISIRTREGIEHLIPNENFINKKMENWTHSDSFIRIHTKFEVDLDTDIELVEKILLDIALKTPRVLKEPKPATRIVSMIQNKIEVKLRVWIQDPQNGLSGIRNDIYKQALLAFKEQGIHIPRPPLDLYFQKNPSLKSVLSNAIQSKETI